MSENPQTVIFKLGLLLGEKNSEHHGNFIKKIESWIDEIFSQETTIEEKEKFLHKIGLADNKIDQVETVEYHKKRLASELELQEIFIEDGQFQNLKESNRRCIDHVKEILRLISPRNLDIGASSQMPTEAKEISESNVM